MKLVNHTPFPAHLFRTAIDDDRLAAAVIVRVTFDLSGDTWKIDPEQVWQVSPGPWDGPHGPMEGDDVFVRGGVDLFVFGHARPLGGAATESQTVVVQIGDFERTLWVYGDRCWEGDGEELRPSRPVPFTAMPLDLNHAFGGTGAWDGLDVPFSDNPEGRGFYLSAEAAVGGPLPNLEDPNHPVQRWQDQPRPVGVGPCPFAFSGRLENIVFSDEGLLREIRPTFFNAAFPEMILPRLAAGDLIFLRGFREDGDMEVEVPHVDLSVRLTFDDQVTIHSPVIDQVGIETDLKRAFVTFRYPFRYTIYPYQVRSCELISDRSRTKASGNAGT